MSALLPKADMYPSASRACNRHCRARRAEL